MRPARAWVLLPLLLFAFVLPACGDDESSTGSTGQQNPADLEGKSWILTQMTTVGGQTEIVDVGVSAQFDGSTISGSAVNVMASPTAFAAASMISPAPFTP